VVDQFKHILFLPLRIPLLMELELKTARFQKKKKNYQKKNQKKTYDKNFKKTRLEINVDLLFK